MPQSKYPELPPERIADALAGDRAAFAELYRCYGLRVRASVAAAIRFRAELVPYLDDILSEVWTRFLVDGCRPLHGFDPQRGSFGYYLRMRTWAMARMLAAQYLRRTRLVELDDPFVSLFGQDGLEGRLLGRDALERLYEAIRTRLDTTDMTIFEHVYVEGRRIDEVGRALGLSKDAAYRRSHRLRAKIQKIADELASHGGQEPVPLVMLVAFVAIAEVLSDFPGGAP
ncbi:RNA polymerase sigma factor [Paraliomyxa miuraensis]|uniref:RNA polymerase sigma factor n=1 Tax=Paraliomyxa miuraensis TaxID=376150 RepID=UPI0022502AAA|nr:sigma-70 family RNA polymerase sigma factor [Paraliomyxa miuraensis]MCX4246897.1 sigma-70 family RNA polymerase sigma factor [Paraliomyxa miuraensis]